MSFFERTFAGLSDLQWVSPDAFRPDDQTPRSVCEFMLALALVHCDVKNLSLFHLALQESRPKGSSPCELTGVNTADS